MTIDPQPVAPDDDAIYVAGSVHALRGVLVFGGCALVIAILYWTQSVLIPIALAVLLSFLLSPVARLFERLRFGRIGSVAVVVLIAFCLLGGIAFGVFTQITRLANDLPGYRSNIRQKVADVQGATQGGVIDKLRQAIGDAMAAFEGKRRGAPRLDQQTDEAKPVPVVMETSVLWQIPTLLEGLASAGLVLVFVIFMLLERRELRDRVIRLLGYGHVAITTRALDEAAGRISRYLVAQSLINAGYGVAIGAGLWFIGLPYALLWGFLTAILRFIPYVGPWLGAGLPVILALAAFPGWTTPLAVIALFLGAELVTNMVVEPLVYGQSAGVSQVALLGLRFIYFLMADQPALEPEARLYQRLLAADLEEAGRGARGAGGRRARLRGARRDAALRDRAARADRATHSLSREEEHNLYQSARTLLATLAEEDAAARTEADGEAGAAEPAPSPASSRARALRSTRCGAAPTRSRSSRRSSRRSRVWCASRRCRPAAPRRRATSAAGCASSSPTSGSSRSRSARRAPRRRRRCAAPGRAASPRRSRRRARRSSSGSASRRARRPPRPSLPFRPEKRSPSFSCACKKRRLEARRDAPAEHVPRLPAGAWDLRLRAGAVLRGDPQARREEAMTRMRVEPMSGRVAVLVVAGCITGVVTAGLTGCAARRPIAELARAEEAVQHARASDEAQRYAAAELSAAEAKLERAYAAADDGDYEDAQRLAEAARAEARIAEARGEAYAKYADRIEPDEVVVTSESGEVVPGRRGGEAVIVEEQRTYAPATGLERRAPSSTVIIEEPAAGAGVVEPDEPEPRSVIVVPE